MNKSIFAITFVALFFIMSTVNADEKVKIENDEQLQAIVSPGDQWECKWIDGPTKTEGTKVYTYEEVSMKKITGTSKNSYCPDSTGTYKAKIKKGRAEGKLKQAKPCLTSWGHYDYYKKADGNHYMKGPYSYRWTDGKVYGGEATCHPI